MSDVSAAISAWKNLLGEGNVLTRVDDIKKYKSDTSGTQREMTAVLRAHSTPDVAAIVKIASQYGVPLYPVSKGNNWGYGSSNPVRDGAVMVDLSGMTQISGFERDLGVVSVEPGVTQQMLADFLKDNNDEYLTPTTGAGPKASILGNSLERGYGLTPVTDHCQAILSVQAVLPDGTLYHSPMHDKGCELIDRLFKWGIGPYLDGLFCQGNFGIVTKITIQLFPRTEMVAAFFIEMNEEKDLEKAVLIIRETLRDLGGVVGSINLMNSLRLLAMSAPYPFDLVKNAADPVAVLKKEAEKMNFAPWTCLGSFYGSKELVRSAQKSIKRKVYPYTKRLIFLSRPQLSFLESMVSFLPPALSKTPLNRIRKMKMSMEILEGRPNQVALPLAYRKLPGGMPDSADLHPARDGCGLIWYSPLVPMRPEWVRKYTDFVYEVCSRHRIEPLITLTTVNSRCFDSSMPIVFNAQNPHETAQAKACYNDLLKEGTKLGFYPYRVNIDAMTDIVDPDQPFWAMQKTLKNALDPKGIISPGRYSAA